MKTDKLKGLSLSQKAIEWFEQQPDFTSAWQTCERGDWMLDIARGLKVNERKLMLTNYHIVNQARHLIKNELSLKALDAAYEYGIGRISIDKLINAYHGACMARFYHQENRSMAHAVLAVHDALAPYEAVYFSTVVYTAIAIADTNNNYDDYMAIIDKSFKESADICRRYLTEEVLTAYNLL